MVISSCHLCFRDLLSSVPGISEMILGISWKLYLVNALLIKAFFYHNELPVAIICRNFHWDVEISDRSHKQSWHKCGLFNVITEFCRVEVFFLRKTFGLSHVNLQPYIIWVNNEDSKCHHTRRRDDGVTGTVAFIVLKSGCFLQGSWSPIRRGEYAGFSFLIHLSLLRCVLLIWFSV